MNYRRVNHPSLALWADVETGGRKEVADPTMEMMSLCGTAPAGAARRVQHLLRIGATHPWTSLSGQTALHHAAMSGSAEVWYCITLFPDQTVCFTGAVLAVGAGTSPCRSEDQLKKCKGSINLTFSSADVQR